MQLAFTDGREIAELLDLQTKTPVGTAPIEYTAKISKDGARVLRKEEASFYRARQGKERFTLTIDHVRESTLVWNHQATVSPRFRGSVETSAPGR